MGKVDFLKKFLSSFEMGASKFIKRYDKLVFIVLILITLLFSFYTRFLNLGNPKFMVFDENFFIPMAEKYRSGEFYGDPHPPLGRLLITFGAVVFGGRAEKLADGTYDVESFVPYRIIPAFFGALIPIVIFFITFLLTKSKYLSFLGSWFVIFDNALVVHSKYALFDSILIFFFFMTLLILLVYLKFTKSLRDEIFKRKNILFRVLLLLLSGLCSGIAISIKLIGVSTIFSILLILLYKTYKDQIHISLKSMMFLLFQMLVPFVMIFLVFVLSYKVHFALFYKPGEDFEEFSLEYQNCIIDKPNCKLKTFDMILESLDWSFGYEKAVPPIDFCKEGEMGSLPFQWPFMARAIPYSFTNYNNKIPIEEVSYVYLTGNPIIWFSALIGLIFSFGLISASVFYRKSFINKEINFLVIIYLANFIPYFRIERVMYFYHYFIAFIISIILLMVLFKRYFEINQGNLTIKNLCLLVYSLILFLSLLSFVVYSPLTYNIKVNVKYVERLILMDYINLKTDPYGYNKSK